MDEPAPHIDQDQTAQIPLALEIQTHHHPKPSVNRQTKEHQSLHNHVMEPEQGNLVTNLDQLAHHSTQVVVMGQLPGMTLQAWKKTVTQLSFACIRGHT